MNVDEFRRDYERVYRALQRELDWRRRALPEELEGRELLINEIVDSLAALTRIKDGAKALLQSKKER